MERNYHRLCRNLGWTMLCHFVLINAVGAVVVLLELLVSPLMGERGYNLFYQLVYAALYLLAFMLPVILFRVLSRDEPFAPMGMSPRFPAVSLPMLLAMVGVTIPCAYLNSYFMYLLELLGLTNPLDYVVPSYAIFPEDFVLLHLTLALVPAFCEEFLFRGLVCSRLLPYGRTTAILGSALLFGLMHGNLGQLFYATIAGIMLGWCYTETHSIWPGVLAHLLNNTISFVEECWYNELPARQAQLYDTLLITGLLVVGGVCFIWLLCRERRRQNMVPTAHGGMPVLGLGRTLADEPDGELALPAAECARGFFRPAMVVYIVLSLLSMLALMVMAL